MEAFRFFQGPWGHWLAQSKGILERMTKDGLGKLGRWHFKTETWDLRPAKFVDAIGSVGQRIWMWALQGNMKPCTVALAQQNNFYLRDHLWLETSVPSHFIDKENEGKGSLTTYPKPHGLKAAKPKVKARSPISNTMLPGWKTQNSGLKNWGEVWRVTGSYDKSLLREATWWVECLRKNNDMWTGKAESEGRGWLGLAATYGHVTN